MTEHANRYARQVILKEIGNEGQKILKDSSVLVVGCGALGSAAGDHLARAGIGRISILDRDVVEIENLQRQILFDEDDIGTPKALTAQEKLKKINTELEFEGIVEDLNPSNAESLMGNVDLVIDGTDNMETRYLINDVCVKRKIPWIYGGAVSTYGMSMNIVPGKTACLVCAFPSIPRAGSLPTCDTVGVLNTVPSIIASIQTSEAMKILLSKKFSRELLIYNVWTHDFQLIKIKRNTDCTCCAGKVFDYLASEKGKGTSVLCGRDSVQIMPAVSTEISLESLAERLKNVGDVKLSPVHLTFKGDEVVISVFKDGRAIVKGTDDETLARSLYAKYIGN